MRHVRLSIIVAPAVWIGLAFAMILLPLRWVIAWLLATTVHELFHILSLLVCGARIHEIRIALSGAQITTDSLTHGKEIISAVAGPLGGVLLLLLSRWLPKTAICAFVQSVFNLLPLVNFDGGRVLHGSLSLLLSENRADKVCDRVDGITRIFLCIFGIYAAWKLSWGLLCFLCCFFLLRRSKNPLQTRPSAGTIVLHES